MIDLRYAGYLTLAGALVPSSAFALAGFETVPFVGAAAVETPSGRQANITSGFNIILNFVNPASASQAAAFTAAEASWESLISGYQSDDLANTNLTIDVNLAPIDGAGGILGSAGPTTGKLNAAQTAINPDFLYAQTGAMTFDSADLAGLETAGTLGAVVEHEMGHVLGIGTLWSSSEAGLPGLQELRVSGSGLYTGAAAVAAYNAEFGQVGASVPVELGGGAGTADGHWNEVDGGVGLTGIVSNITGQDFRNELMTGWLNAPAFRSTVSEQTLVDMGYVLVPEPASAVLLLSGLGLLAARRRRG